jgi:hypothetical protein
MPIQRPHFPAMDTMIKPADATSPVAPFYDAGTPQGYTLIETAKVNSVDHFYLIRLRRPAASR